MNRRQLWLLLCAALLVFGAESRAADAAKVGTIKGIITVAGKPTADAVVSVEGVTSGGAKLAAAKSKKSVMDQREMKFVPFVLPVLVGTTVDFPNRDKSWHNVYAKSEAKQFDLGLYAPGKSRSATFNKPGVVRILCNVHPSMEAFIVVKEHPYFSATDNRGNYRLDGVPLGKYRVQVWHPQLGTTESPVELVREGEVLELSFDLKKK